MAFLGVSVKSGEVVRERVGIGSFADGSSVYIPVVAIGGTKAGPTVYLQAGVHGDELTGIEVLRRTLLSLDPDQVRGRIVAVPVANVPAFLTRTRGFAGEERGPMDMNRIFPGNSGGLLSERIVDALFSEFLSVSDYAIDFHSALAGCEICPFVYVQAAPGTVLYEAQSRLAHALGTPLIYYQEGKNVLGTSDMSKSFLGAAASAGVPAIIAEMGESERIAWPVVGTSVSGTLNALRELGVVGGPAPEDWVSTTAEGFRRLALLHASSGGLLELQTQLGNEVAVGDAVATIHSIDGGGHEEVRASEAGRVLRLMRRGACHSGAEVAWIATDLFLSRGSQGPA